MEKIICKVRFYFDESKVLCYKTEILQAGLPEFQWIGDTITSRGDGDGIVIIRSIPYSINCDLENELIVVSVEASELKNRKLYAVVETENGEQRQQFTSVHRGVSEVFFTGIGNSAFSVYVVEK